MVNVLSRLSFSRIRAGDHADIGLRLLHADAALQTRHQVVIFVAAPVDGIGAQRQRQNDLGFANVAYGRHYFVIEQEIRPQHARHRELVLIFARAAAPRSVQRHALAHNVRIAVEQALPRVIAEDRHRRLAGRIVFRQQHAAHQGLHSEQPEQPRRRLQQVHPLRPVEPHQSAGVAM